MFCRIQMHNFYLSSTAYRRGRISDRFVSVQMKEIFVGEIQFFFRRKRCSGFYLKVFEIIRRIRLLKNRQPSRCPVFGYVVKESEKKIRFPTSAISKKLFPVFKDELTLLTILNHFEHD